MKTGKPLEVALALQRVNGASLTAYPQPVVGVQIAVCLCYFNWTYNYSWLSSIVFSSNVDLASVTCAH